MRRVSVGTRVSRPHKGWHSRGYLPHLDSPGLVQSITFRLFDSIPAEILATWQIELEFTRREAANDPRHVELRRRIEEYIDRGHGACWLRDERVAELVEKALLHFDGARYRLLAWVIMPNHVHTLIEVLPGYPLDGVVQSWKSFTAKKANKLIGRNGRFWMPEYFDRYIRSEGHLAAVPEYIEQNPVEADLVDNACDWLWSSAQKRKRAPRA